MCCLICIREPAADLVYVVSLILVHEAERNDLFIAELLGHRVVIESILVHPGRSSRLEPSYRETELPQIISKLRSRPEP